MFWCSEQFYVPIRQIQSNLGKNTEIYKQSHVKFWFNRKNMELSHIFLAVIHLCTVITQFRHFFVYVLLLNVNDSNAWKYIDVIQKLLLHLWPWKSRSTGWYQALSNLEHQGLMACFQQCKQTFYIYFRTVSSYELFIPFS